MQKFLIKTVHELLSGEIILHPIFRSDGLLMVTRYKVLEGSILKHIKQQTHKDLKVLTVQSKQELDIMKDYWRENQQEYMTIIKEICEQHRQFSKIHLESHSFIDPKIIANHKIETQNQAVFDTNETLFLSPLWSQMDTIIDSKSIKKRIKKIFNRLQNVIKQDDSIYKLYHQLSTYHDVLMIHSANTACLSFIIGLTLELPDEEIIDLSLAALFADIGFTKYPQSEFIEYLKDSSTFHSKELLINHIRHSVEEISLSPSCRKKSIIFGVLDHHEHIDGNGLPNGKSGNDIHLFARIISIAQYYDILVGGYTDKGIYPSLEAYQMILQQIGKIFDKSVFELLLHRTMIFKVGEDILLSEYKKGIILGFSDYINYPLEPIVKLTDGTIVNLYNH